MNITNAEDLRAKFGGLGLKFTWMGVERKAEVNEANGVADLLGASPRALKIQKVLIDTKGKDYRKLTSIRSRIRARWHEETLPWIEPGVRLMNKEMIPGFKEHTFLPMREEILLATKALADRWPEVLAEAPKRLGSLFRAADYPQTPLGLFEAELTFPNLEPPGYLPPEVFAEQSKLVAEKFKQALKVGEAALAQELKDLLDNLADKLQPGEDGKPKVFKSSSVENVYDFFEKIQKLGFGSSKELSEGIANVTGALKGLHAGELRGLNQDSKSHIQETLKKVSQSLEGSVQSLPRRKLNIKKKQEAA